MTKQVEGAAEAATAKPVVGMAPMNATELAAKLGDRLGDMPLQSAAEKARDEKAEDAANHERMTGEAFADVRDRADAIAAEALTPEGLAKALVDARFASIDADSNAEISGADYAELIGRVFDPMWPTWERADIATAGNLAPVMAAFFAEKDDYYANYRRLRARFSAKPNPRTSWARFEKYQMETLRRAQRAKQEAEAAERGETLAAEPKASRGDGSRLSPEDALHRDLPGLYLRVQKAIPNDGNARLEDIGTKLHAVLAMVCSPTELQAIAEKIVSKPAK